MGSRKVYFIFLIIYQNTIQHNIVFRYVQQPQKGL